MIKLLKELIIAAGKRPYVLAMGKPSPAKLGNFLDLDVFVLVACPENSLLETRDFHVPVVTPFELLLAMSSDQEWTGKYDLNLASVSEQLEIEIVAEKERQGNEADDGEPYFSLVTGGYKQRRAGRDPTLQETLESGTVAQRNSHTQVQLFDNHGSGARDYFPTRSFKGLTVDAGQTPVSLAVTGREGVASGYSTEPAE